MFKTKTYRVDILVYNPYSEKYKWEYFDSVEVKATTSIFAGVKAINRMKKMHPDEFFKVKQIERIDEDDNKFNK